MRDRLIFGLGALVLTVAVGAGCTANSGGAAAPAPRPAMESTGRLELELLPSDADQTGEPLAVVAPAGQLGP